MFQAFPKCVINIPNNHSQTCFVPNFQPTILTNSCRMSLLCLSTNSSLVVLSRDFGQRGSSLQNQVRHQDQHVTYNFPPTSSPFQSVPRRCPVCWCMGIQVAWMMMHHHHAALPWRGGQHAEKKSRLCWEANSGWLAQGKSKGILRSFRRHRRPPDGEFGLGVCTMWKEQRVSRVYVCVRDFQRIVALVLVCSVPPAAVQDEFLPFFGGVERQN